MGTIMPEENWTPQDTKICETAENSGMAINPSTNEPVTIEELDNLATQYDKVRSITTVDEFFNGNLDSKPFEF